MRQIRSCRSPNARAAARPRRVKATPSDFRPRRFADEEGDVRRYALGLSASAVLGALSVLPPMLCWYFPSLMPMVPLALLLMFLSWLAVARKPAYFTSEFYPASEKTTAFGRA